MTIKNLSRRVTETKNVDNPDGSPSVETLQPKTSNESPKQPDKQLPQFAEQLPKTAAVNPAMLVDAKEQQVQKLTGAGLLLSSFLLALGALLRRSRES